MLTGDADPDGKTGPESWVNAGPSTAPVALKRNRLRSGCVFGEFVSFRAYRRRLGDALDRNRLEDHFLVGLVLGGGLHFRNLVGYFLPFYHFAKDCVFANQMRSGRNRYEELTPVGIRSAVGHGQLAGLVELVRRAL